MEKFLNPWQDWQREERRNETVTELIVFVVGKYQQISQVITEQLGVSGSFIDVRILLQEIIRYQNTVAEHYWKMCNEHYAIWKTALLNSFSQGELKVGINLESIAHHFMYIEEGVIMSARPEDSYQDTTYRMDKAFKEFYEIIRR